MESSIKESIKKYKEGNDRERMLSEIISKMTPIINKYARRLYYLEYEDMKQELLIAIIEAVMRIETYDKEGQCINYLVSAVKMRYWELCRKSTNNQDSYANVELLYEYPDKKVKDQFEEIEFMLDLNNLKKVDNEMKREVFNYILTGNMSDAEIAKRLNVSRQYINRCKKRIFESLREY